MTQEDKDLLLKDLCMRLPYKVKAFVPSTKEALMIYGIGSTIEYLKSNEKAMQLPDKCINALDAWVEELNKEEKKDSERKDEVY